MSTAFEAGQDYARNGANTENCNFKWFGSPESTAEWERGRDSIKQTIMPQPDTPKVEPPKDEIEKMAEEYANRIGSPWGEGATYEPDRPQKAREEGLGSHSHLDDSSKTNFIKDLTQSILALIKLQQEALLSKLEAELPEPITENLRFDPPKDSIVEIYKDGMAAKAYNICLDQVKKTINKLRLEL